MTRIVAIVEGHGEVAAVPILLRRIAQAHDPRLIVDVPKPLRVPRRKILKPGELERHVEFAARQAGEGGSILILLDADRDCPKELSLKILDRACAKRSDRTIRVVFAKVEFESWFLAAAESIAGHRGLPSTLLPPPDSESVRDAKGWLSAQMMAGRSYSETLDQPALTSLFDLQLARQARSFDKLWRDVTSML